MTENKHMRPALRGLVAGMVCLVAGGMAWAQTGNGLPEALRDIKQADGVCKNESPNATVRASAAATTDAACAMPAGSIDAFVQGGGAVVIDTRTEAQFAQFHAPNAMRLDLPAVAYKAYLKDKPLLLVGTGRSDRELYAACTNLRGKGFKAVHVIAGGMAAYVAAGKKVAGRPPAALELARLDAGQLAEEAQFADNFVVMLGTMRASDALPYATALPEATPEALAALVAKRRKEGRTPLATVVLAAAAPLTDATFARYLIAAKPSPLLVYEDGPETLAKFMASQKAAWAAHARGPKQPRCG